MRARFMRLLVGAGSLSQRWLTWPRTASAQIPGDTIKIGVLATSPDRSPIRSARDRLLALSSRPRISPEAGDLKVEIIFADHQRSPTSASRLFGDGWTRRASTRSSTSPVAASVSPSTPYA